MDAIVALSATALIFAVFALIATAIEGLWKWFGFWAVVVLASVSILVPSAITSWNQNAERVARERTACQDAGLIWVADREVCVNDQGWVVKAL